MTEDEILDRVRCLELQRTVDNLVEDGMLIEVAEGHYIPYEEGPGMGGPCEMRPRLVRNRICRPTGRTMRRLARLTRSCKAKGSMVSEKVAQY